MRWLQKIRLPDWLKDSRMHENKDARFRLPQSGQHPFKLEAELQSAVRDLLRQIKSRLNTPSYFDARWLLGLAVGRDAPVFGHESLILTVAQAANLEALIAQRNSGCPISRMRGKREFYSSCFYLNDHTLDPRPDSECLIDAAVQYTRSTAFNTQALCCLDLGTGSGCLLLSLLGELPHAFGLGVDLAPLAVSQARANAAQLGLAARARFICSDWFEGVQGSFELILANPPYIPTGDSKLARDVADFDPSLALFAGTDGLDAYAKLLPQIPARLLASGRLFLEIGAEQTDAVKKLAEQAGLQLYAVCSDLAGHDRCLILGKK